MRHYLNRQAEPSPCYYAFSVEGVKGIYRYYATWTEQKELTVVHTLLNPEGDTIDYDFLDLGFPNQSDIQNFVNKLEENSGWL
jgi:hypothetical protein